MITPPEYKPKIFYPFLNVKAMIDLHKKRWGMYFYLINNGSVLNWFRDPMEKFIFPKGQPNYPEIKCTLQEYLET